MTETSLEKIMSEAREAASKRKRSLEVYVEVLNDEARRIEASVEAAMLTGLCAAPDPDAMWRAQVHKAAARQFEFQAKHQAKFVEILRRLGFAEWLKSQAQW